MTTHSAVFLEAAAVAPTGARPTRPRQGAYAAPRARAGRLGGLLLHLPRMSWMLLDVFLLCLGTMLGDSLFVWWGSPDYTVWDSQLWLVNIVLATTVMLSGSVVGLYEPGTLWARSRIVVRCLLTVTIAMLIAWLVMHLLMYTSLSRRAAATGVLFYLATACPVRLMCHHVVQDVRRGLLVIGQGPMTGTIIRSVRRGSVPGYRLIGVVSSDRAGIDDQGMGDIPIVGDIGAVESLCREHQVAEVVVAETALRNPRYQRAALACLGYGCRVTDETTFFESAYGEVPVSHITPQWFLSADLKGHREEHAVLKRFFDVVVSLLAMTFAAPLVALIAILIWLEDRGAVFYSQTRVGQSGRPFTLYKFRTMRINAEANGTTWAAANDSRVTRVGRVLRQLRFDELPQFWNILRGDMSVVGPRPERPEFVRPLANLIPFFNERHLIKPGLTGWAQINYPYGATVADARQKLQLDLYYIKHISFELDLIILLRTLGIFFKGAR